LSTFTGGTTKALTLAAILVLAVAIRIYCFHGYWGTDDGEYARLANAMAKGQFGAFVNENYIQHAYAPAHLPYRIALIAPLALLFKLFGVSEAVLVAYPMAVSVLGVLLAFVCGRLLFGPQVGLVAAALWSVLPEDVSLASIFLPDAIASFYASLGVLIVLFLKSRDGEAFASICGWAFRRAALRHLLAVERIDFLPRAVLRRAARRECLDGPQARPAAVVRRRRRLNSRDCRRDDGLRNGTWRLHAAHA
jgi:hypothetical protein